MQKVLEGELTEFTKDMNKAVNETAVDENLVKGNVLFKTMFNRTCVKELTQGSLSLIPSEFNPGLIDVRETYNDYPRTEKKNWRKDSDKKSVTHYPFFDKVTNRTLNIDAKADWKTCINIINEWRDKLGKNFYGAVIRDASKKDIIMNPLHILTSILLISDQDTQYLKKAKFNIIIYYYPDREELDKQFASELCLKEDGINRSNEIIDNITKTYSNRTNTLKRVSSVGDVNADGSMVVQYQTLKHVDESSSEEHYVVAHQLLTNGILAPYYGTSLLNMRPGSDTKGTPLGPIRSCNIPEISVGSSNYNTVCTGSSSNRSLDGLRTLTHAYLGSPYTCRTMEEGSLIYIDCMIEKSIGLFKTVGIIPEAVQEVVESEA